MDELWIKFWNSFWKMCYLEFQNVSFIYFLIFSLIGACVVHIGCMIYVRVRKKTIFISTELMFILLISYFFFILQVTLLGRAAGSQPRVLDTKWLWFNNTMDQNMTNLLNIILFLPLGALLTGVQKYEKVMKRTVMVVNYCFLISLLIESMQYMSKRGYFEIDDIESNIIGGLFGSIFVNLFSKIGRLINKNRRSEDEERT